MKISHCITSAVGSNTTKMKIIQLVIILTIILPINFTYAQGKTDSLQYTRLTKFSVFSTSYFNYGSSEFETNNVKGYIEMDEWSTVFQFVVPLKDKSWYLFNRIQYTISYLMQQQT